MMLFFFGVLLGALIGVVYAYSVFSRRYRERICSLEATIRGWQAKEKVIARLHPQISPE